MYSPIDPLSAGLLFRSHKEGEGCVSKSCWVKIFPKEDGFIPLRSQENIFHIIIKEDNLSVFFIKMSLVHLNMICGNIEDIKI